MNMFNYYNLYFIDMSIKEYKRNMIYPIWNLQLLQRIRYNDVYGYCHNRYFQLIRLYNFIKSHR